MAFPRCVYQVTPITFGDMNELFDLRTLLEAGAAEMVLQQDEHPANLRDQVTSPGGTTIAGLSALEAGAFRATLIEAVRTATQRSIELGES